MPYFNLKNRILIKNVILKINQLIVIQVEQQKVESLIYPQK